MDSITKKCNRCKNEKSLSEFNRDSHTKDGYYTFCKECKKESRKKEWGANYRSRHAEQKAEYGKKYNAEHKKETHDRYILNLAKHAEYGKRRYAEKKAEIREYYRKWRNNNYEKKRAYDSEYGKKYRKEHPEKSKEYDHRRRAKEKNSGGGGFTKDEWEQLKKDYNYLCAYCGRKKPLTIDHIIPLDGGGLHDISNMIPACKSCNSGKQAKPLLVYLLHRLKNG